MNKTARSRLALALIVVFLSALGIAAYMVYTAFYNQILEKSMATIKVEEIRGTSPLQLRIMIDSSNSALVIRSVTTRRRGSEITVFCHQALVGLAKSTVDWGKAYVLTVPDSVNEVRFGRGSVVIWRRSSSTH
jgi:hypothetical protein